MKTVLVSIAAVLLLVGALPGSASARLQPPAKPKSNVEIVDFDGEYERGTIVVRTSEKRLYYVLGDGAALRYPVGVGEPRFQWTGELWVSSKQVNPTWRPTARMRRENPRLPKAVGPGPRNPLGPRALYLGWGEYRIHERPRRIRSVPPHRAAAFACIMWMPSTCSTGCISVRR